MKTWFSYLAAAAALCLLAGCGGGGGSSANSSRDTQLNVVSLKAAALRTGVNPFPHGTQGKSAQGTSYIVLLHTRKRVLTRDIQPDPDFPPLFSMTVFNSDGSFTIDYFTDPLGAHSAGSLNAGALQSVSNGQTVHFTLNLSAGPSPATQYPLGVVGDYFFFNDDTSEIKATVTDVLDGTVNYDCFYDANGVQTACTQSSAVTAGSGTSNVSVAFVSQNSSTGASTYSVSDPTDGISGQLIVNTEGSGSGHLSDTQGETADLVWNTAGIGTITFRDNRGKLIETDPLNLFGS